jgi:hypothetical protein
MTFLHKYVVIRSIDGSPVLAYFNSLNNAREYVRDIFKKNQYEVVNIFQDVEHM